MTKKSLGRSRAANKSVLAWVDDMVRLCQPDRVFWCDGSEAENANLIEQMLAEKRPCVVDFRVEREENVWPMVPAGKSLSDMDGLGILESMA